MDYRKGRGKYDFSALEDQDRDNAAYDAWVDIEALILEALLIK